MYVIACSGEIITVALDGQEVALYECLKVDNVNVIAEVFFINMHTAICVAYGDTKNITIGSLVVTLGGPLKLEFNKSKIGHVLNPLMEIISENMIIDEDEEMIIENEKEEENRAVDYAEVLLRKEALQASDVIYNPSIMHTGVKIIDFMLPYSPGTRFGVVGGAGAGKTTLILDLVHLLTRKKKKDNSFFVFSGVGERIREGRDLYVDVVRSGLIDYRDPNESRTMLIYGNMDQTASMRALACLSGITIADHIADYYQSNVVLVIDNLYRYALAMSELYSSLDIPLSEMGYFAGMDSSVAQIMERILQRINRNGSDGNDITTSITGICAIFVPADNNTDPGVTACTQFMDTIIKLDRDIAKQKRFPAINILDSSSSMIQPELIGERHYNLHKRVMETLKRYEDVREMINILGFENLSEEDKNVAYKAKIIYSYMTQVLPISSSFNNMKPKSVAMEDILNDIEKILSGALNETAPESFMYIGKIG